MKKNKKHIFYIVLFFALIISGCSFSGGLNKTPQPFNDKICSTTFFKTTNLVVEEEINLADTYNEVKKSVVTLFVFDSLYNQKASGSGVVIGEDENYGYLYTNAHVVNGGSKFEVVFYNFIRKEAIFLQGDNNEDVAILRFEKNDNYTVADLGNSEEISIGQGVFTIGSPLGLNQANTLTSGVISNVDIRVDSSYLPLGQSSKYLIQIDAALNPGNSGGPLFSRDGRVLGINTLKITKSQSGDDVESFNYAIPINHFDLVATSLLESGQYKRPKIGITVKDISFMSLDEREKENIDLYLGVLIIEVSPQGAGHNLLEEGNVIVEINDVEIINLNQFSKELLKNLPGEEIKITFFNQTTSQFNDVFITLGQ